MGALDFCKSLEEAGVSAITVHGRTAKQLYTGVADWESIGKIASKMKIPILGNGDVSEDNALERLNIYPIAGLMIGRNALSNPEIFNQLANSTTHTARNLQNIILRHIEYSKEYYENEQFIVHKLRKHFAYYLRNIDATKQTKLQILRANSLMEIKNAIESIGIY